MADLVVVDRVSRHFDTGGVRLSAVREVSLAVAAGELVAVLGRSGSGKTTLLGLTGGLDRPDEGRITVAGNDIGKLDESGLDEFRRHTVGWVFQSSGLLPLLTAEENVALGLQIQGVAEGPSRVAARAALERIGLAERSGHRAYELSGGEQQRVALARALIKEPRLLLADEPTGQLDTDTSAEVMILLRQAASSGISVLVATHDSGLAESADRVLRIADGALV